MVANLAQCAVILHVFFLNAADAAIPQEETTEYGSNKVEAAQRHEHEKRHAELSDHMEARGVNDELLNVHAMQWNPSWECFDRSFPFSGLTNWDRCGRNAIITMQKFLKDDPVRMSFMTMYYVDLQRIGFKQGWNRYKYICMPRNTPDMLCLVYDFETYAQIDDGGDWCNKGRDLPWFNDDGYGRFRIPWRKVQGRGNSCMIQGFMHKIALETDTSMDIPLVFTIGAFHLETTLDNYSQGYDLPMMSNNEKAVQEIFYLRGALSAYDKYIKSKFPATTTRHILMIDTNGQWEHLNDPDFGQLILPNPIAYDSGMTKVVPLREDLYYETRTCCWEDGFNRKLDRLISDSGQFADDPLNQTEGWRWAIKEGRSNFYRDPVFTHPVWAEIWKFAQVPGEFHRPVMRNFPTYFRHHEARKRKIEAGYVVRNELDDMSKMVKKVQLGKADTYQSRKKDEARRQNLLGDTDYLKPLR